MTVVRMPLACINSNLVLRIAGRYVFRLVLIKLNPSLTCIQPFLFIQYNVSLPRQGPPPAPGSRPPKVYKIKVTKVAEINTEYDLPHRDP